MQAATRWARADREFPTVDNTQGSTDDEHEIEKSVTEESSSEVSFSENVELSNKTTIEAGTDTAKVSDELTETFGFSKGDVEGHSSSTSVTIRDKIVVPAGTKAVIVFTDDAAGVDCDVDICALADWTKIEWTGDDRFWESKWAHLVDTSPHHHGQTFDGWQAWLSFVHGYDVRCLQAATLLTRGYADSHQLARVAEMADKDIRQIAFTGTRRTSSTRDASYRVVDATGLDDSEIHDAYSERGPLGG